MEERVIQTTLTEVAMGLLKKRKYKELREIMQELNPVDIAVLLQGFPNESLPLIFRILPKELAADTFVEMDSDEQELLISAFSDFELKEVLDDLFLDDAVDIIEEMPANVVRRILRTADPDMRESINQLLNYPKDSAGSIMTIEYVSLKADMTVSDAFTRIRRVGIDKETIYTCYVVDEDRTLVGIVTVKTLLLSDENCLIRDIMEDNVIYAQTTDDKENVAQILSKYDFLAVPVVDGEKRLVGIVTFDDAIDVLQEENTEDFEKMAALLPSEDSYFKTSVWKHFKNRIVWLLVLMLSATVSGIIITKYQTAFVAVPLLMSFLPQLTDTGGNCGSQSSTLIIRGLALKDVELKDYFKVIWKEFRISLLIGAVLCVVNMLRVYIMYREITLACILGAALFCTVIIAKFLGCSMPMLARRVGLDPAIMASPLITTIVDACSVLIYFNIAVLVLKI